VSGGLDGLARAAGGAEVPYNDEVDDGALSVTGEARCWGQQPSLGRLRVSSVWWLRLAL
jgi:hypothetical protein